MPFTMNSQTGEMSFLPNAIGSYEVSCKVYEYRNGVLIGSIRRDMQIIVTNSFNNPPTVNQSGNVSPFSGAAYTVSSGNSITLSVYVDDQDGQFPAVTSTGEPLVLSSNPATFNIVSSTANTSTASVTWTPDVSQARTSPYIFAFRCAEHFGNEMYFRDATFSVKVDAATSVDSKAGNNIVSNIYPNPGAGNFTLELNSLNSKDVELSICNIHGQQLKKFQQHLAKGINLVAVNNLQLADGFYILNIISDGRINDSKTFEIKK